MKSNLKTAFSRLVKKVTKNKNAKSKDDDDEGFEEIQRPTSFDNRRSIVEMLPPMRSISGSLDISISGFLSSSSLVAVPSPCAPLPRIVVTASSASPLNTTANTNSIYQYRHSQISLSPFDITEGARSSLSLSPFSSSVRLSQLSQASSAVGVGTGDPRDLDTIFRRVNQEFDSLREEIRMLRQWKEKSDRAYEAELSALRMRVRDLEEEAGEGRVERGLRRLTRGDERSLIMWEDYGSPTSPLSLNDPSTFSLPYDPSRRCAVSAEKLLASAPDGLDDDASETESPLKERRYELRRTDLSTIESCSFASSSHSNSIPFPCVSRPSSPSSPEQMHESGGREFCSFMDLNDATFSGACLPFTEATTVDKVELTRRISIVSLVRKKYQSGEDSRDRRAMSTPPILPSQIGTIALEYYSQAHSRSGSGETEASFIEELPEGYSLSYSGEGSGEGSLETPDQSGLVNGSEELAEEPFVYMPSERMPNIDMLLRPAEPEEEEDTMTRFDIFPSSLNCSLSARRTPTPDGSRKPLAPKATGLGPSLGMGPVFSKENPVLKEKEREAGPVWKGKENILTASI